MSLDYMKKQLEDLKKNEAVIIRTLPAMSSGDLHRFETVLATRHIEYLILKDEDSKKIIQRLLSAISQEWQNRP